LTFILNLAKQKGFEQSVNQPIGKFVAFIEKKRGLQRISDFLDINEKAITPMHETKWFYKKVLKGFEGTKREDKEINNKIDALLADMTYQLDRYFYKETQSYFTILTSSGYPIKILGNLTYKGAPFCKTPIARSPEYLLAKYLYLKDVNDPIFLKKSAKIFGRIEKTGDLTTLYTDLKTLRVDKHEEDLYDLSVLLNLFYYDKNWTKQYQNLMIEIDFKSLSHLKLTQAIDNKNNELLVDENLLLNAVELEFKKESYEANMISAQEGLKEQIRYLYTKTLDFVKDFDVYLLPPEMLELHDRVLDGD
jgi:hypothetical protein